MTGTALFSFGSSALLFGVSLFCANLLLLRRDHAWVYWPLAIFCLTEAALELPAIIEPFVTSDPARALLMRFSLLTLPLAFLLAPLFWIYARGLTSEGEPGEIPYKLLHLLPAMLALVLALVLMAHPEMMADNPTPPTFVERLLYLGLLGLAGLLYLQVALYLVLIHRQILTYRLRLKDLFASTEDRELHWIVCLGVVLGLYWLFNSAVLLAETFDLVLLPRAIIGSAVLSDLLDVGVIWVIAVWGTRQKPGLLRPAEVAPDPAGPGEDPTPKYERSALTADHAARIAARIEAAMRRDLLYRDPNLSLWGLAKHIGVTSNYVSQTLNETLGESFFDYVNGWRVRDAIGQLTATDQTILAIAYDVGFNSRSPFYKAFKRETGKTPTELRAERTVARPPTVEGLRKVAG
ncbi:helix-turn-helix transcriptional regulator [Frigidibacter sp. RF13]|uniref:helix-turn-helix domain-containing protein n=1 Tax=Frigidibacter sp. RF13 TaxID=2997340 RepID=UPI00226E5555|nr:helix-turn-helix transcriptional regulator [Frigidibacter sp. RF13]MCY1127040.1 helix-turn-helix transcriptional regulator [Frigidibacter sp. RF13]